MVGDKPLTEFGRIPSRPLTPTDRSVFPHSVRMDSTARGSGGWWTRRISWPAFATGRLRKSQLAFPPVERQEIDQVFGQHFKGKRPLRRQDDELAQFVVRLRAALERQNTGTKAVGIKVEVFGRLISPHLIAEISGLVRPSPS